MTAKRDSRSYGIAAFSVVAAIVVTIAVLSLSRDYFGLGTEADYLGVFIKEAARFQRGEQLELLYHPPFYSIVISLIQPLTSDWFVTGKAVSLFAVAVVLVTTFLFFDIALSRAAAMGTVLALAASPQFLKYGTLATSDVFFLALYTSGLLMALQATRRRSVLLWIATGLIVGAAILSRTNGISLLLLLFVPWLESDEPLRQRTKASLALMLGFVVPVLVWGGYASLTGAPLAPTNTHINLAWTFFPPDGVTSWADGIEYAEQTFTSPWSVLAHDPMRLVQKYLTGLYRLPMRLGDANGLLAYPLNLLFLPAILYLLYSVRDRWVMYAVILALGQVALMGFNIFLPRYYLFLIPVIGAAIGHTAGQIFLSPDRYGGGVIGQSSARLILLGVGMLAVSNSVRGVHEFLIKTTAELGESVPAVTAIIAPRSVVVARKPVIAFYTESKAAGMPAGDSLADLRRHVVEHGGEGEVFVYYGSAEQRARPEYSELKTSPETIPWLKLEASSAKPGNWCLFRFIGTKTSTD